MKLGRVLFISGLISAPIFLGLFLILNEEKGELEISSSIPISEYEEPVKIEAPDIEVEAVIYEEFVFVEDAHSSEVIVLSLEGEIVKRIPVGDEPHDIAVSPDHMYVATANAGDGSVSLISTASLEVVGTYPSGKGAHGVTFSPDGKFIFVANSEENTLSVFDASDMSKQKKISVDQYPEYVGITRDGSKVFTTNLGDSGSLTVLENRGPDSRVIKSMDLGIDPHGWAISPDGTKVVVTNLGSNFTYILDSTTFDIVSKIDTGATTEFAAFLNDTELWVTDIGAHYVSIIDVEKNALTDQIRVGEMPHGISFSDDRTRAFIPLYGLGELVTVDTLSREIISRVQIGRELHNAVVVEIAKR